MLLSLIFCFAWFAFADPSDQESQVGYRVSCVSDGKCPDKYYVCIHGRCSMPTVATDTEALAAESQEKAVGNWGAIRCYKRCRRVGGTVSNCHAACPSNTETEVAGDISACDEAIEATMQDGSCCPYDNARWDWSKLSDHPEECCEGIVSMDNPNECPPVCNEATEATMKDGSCCPYDNARWDWSNPTVVPDHPEECCEGIVSMDNPNECPAVETPPAYTVGDKGKRARGCPDGYEAIKNGEECKAALKFLEISRKGVKNSSKKACYKGKNGRGYNNGNAGAGASYICKVEGKSSSSMVNEAIGSMGTQQFVKLFALIGAASIMFHGAKIVYKGLCTSNEEFHQINDAEC